MEEKVERTLSTMIISEEAAVKFTTDLLASTLLTTPVQENIPAHPSSADSALDIPTLNSPKRTTELPPTSGTGALLDTTTTLSSSITRLVTISKILLIFLSLLFIHVHAV